MTEYNLKMGSDPELFVYDRDSKEYIPAFGVLGDDRDIALPFGTLVPDGLALEFTVRPSANPKDLAYAIAQNVRAVREIVTACSPSYELSANPYAPVSEMWREMLDATYGTRCSLQVFGCSPDETVYPSTEIVRPDPRTFPFRSSGGHIHLDIGAMAEDRQAWSYLTVVLDAFLGTAVTAASKSEEAKLRKVLYGKAGYVRIKPVRPTVLEYRVLTAQALLSSNDTCLAIFTAAKDIVQFAHTYWTVDRAEYLLQMLRIVGDKGQRMVMASMINEHDTSSCATYLKNLRGRVPDVLKHTVDELSELTLDTFAVEVN